MSGAGVEKWEQKATSLCAKTTALSKLLLGHMWKKEADRGGDEENKRWVSKLGGR